MLTCSNVPLQQQYGALTGLASRCRAANNCRGFLDTAFGASLSSLVPSNASELCSGRLWVAATAAKPNGTNDTAVLLGSRWNSSGEIVAAAQVSSYLPGISSPSATKLAPELPNLGPAYDGGFSDALPCPPGGRLLLFPWTALLHSVTGDVGRVQLSCSICLSHHLQPAVNLRKGRGGHCCNQGLL